MILDNYARMSIIIVIIMQEYCYLCLVSLFTGKSILNLANPECDLLLDYKAAASMLLKKQNAYVAIFF